MSENNNNAIKILDLDSIFEKSVREAMMKNKGKFTEDEWEDKIAKMYSEFGNAPLKILDGKSPEEYYKSFSANELADALKKHVLNKVAVPSYLCDALSTSDCVDALMPFLDESDPELICYAANILSEKKDLQPLKVFLEKITRDETNEDVRDCMGSAVIDRAKEIQPELLKVKGNASKGELFVAEALSHCDMKQEIFDYLSGLFTNATEPDEIGLYACFLTNYGDDRAVELFKRRITDPDIDYAVYTDLKSFIEELGGECDYIRDFSDDYSYKKIKNFS